MAKQPSDNQIIYFPEFEKYEIFEGKNTVEPKEGIFTKTFKFFGNGLGSIGSYIGGKYQEYDIGSKLKSGGTATLNGLSKAVGYTSNQAVNLYRKVTGNNAQEGNEITLKDSKETDETNIIKIKEDSDSDEGEIIEKVDDDQEDNENRIIEEKYEEINSSAAPSNYNKI